MFQIIIILEFWKTGSESEICEMLQFTVCKNVIFEIFSLSRETCTTQTRPTGCFISICNEGAPCVVLRKLIAAANCPIFS